jgi:hypothetical protein
MADKHIKHIGIATTEERENGGICVKVTVKRFHVWFRDFLF